MQELRHTGSGIHSALLSHAGIRMGLEELTELILHLPQIDTQTKELKHQIHRAKNCKRQRLTELDLYLEQQDDDHPIKRYKHDICVALNE